MSDVDLQLALALSAVAAGAVLAWLAVRSALAGAPEDDRRWRERPPLGWRIAWPLLAPLAAWLEPVLPPRWRAARAASLRQAGLDAALDPAHLAAACVLVSVGTACLAGAAAPGSLVTIGAAAALGAWLPASWIRDRRSARLRAIGRMLPFYLDLVTLSVESGANLTGALRHAVAKGPPGPLRAELERVLRDVRAGRSRADALRAMADRLELASVTSWVSALVVAERHGTGLGPVLRAQAEQRRQERFQQAEKRAMKAPVKMLFPLLLFIFPCTFVLLFFPVVVRLLQEGLLR